MKSSRALHALLTLKLTTQCSSCFSITTGPVNRKRERDDIYLSLFYPQLHEMKGYLEVYDNQVKKQVHFIEKELYLEF